MARKQLLVIGAMLIAAGIGAPATVILTSGAAIAEPGTPAVEATVPGPPYVPVGNAGPTSAAPTARTARIDGIVPPGTGIVGLPPVGRPEAQVPATRTPQPVDPPSGEPTAPHPAEMVPPPQLPGADRDPADR